MGFKDGFVQLFVQLFVQATLWIRQHAFLRSAQTLEVFLDRHLSSATSSNVATGEGNLQYNYFRVSSNFRRFNF